MSNDFPMLPAWAWRKSAMEDEDGWPGMKPMLDRIENRARELTAAQQPAPESSGCMSCGCPISGAHYNGCVALQLGFNIHAQPAAGNEAVRALAKKWWNEGCFTIADELEAALTADQKEKT